MGRVRLCVLVSSVVPNLLMAGLAVAEPGQVVGLSPHDQAEHYLESIDQIEAEHGPYAMELSDMHIGLAQSLFEAGEYWEARDAFQRAVMVVRVNLGPNSPEQTNHLFLLANIELMINGPEATNKILDNIHRINSAHYSDDSVEMLTTLERLYHWNLLINPVGTDQTDYLDYVKNIKLTSEMSRISEKALGPAHEQTAMLHRRHGEAQFQVVRYLRGLKKRLNSLNDMSVASTPFSRSFVSNISPKDHYHDGRRAFRKYEESVRLNESNTPSDRARALAEIGDWFLLLGEYGESEDYYRKSYDVLVQNEAFSSLAASHMSRPEPMHLFPDSRVVLDPPVAVPDEKPVGIEGLKLDLSMTVTDVGKVQRVEFLGPADVLSPAQVRNIKLQVEKNPFRPAMKEGELVTTREFVWVYEVTTNDAGQ